jgi:hypothetical protein
VGAARLTLAVGADPDDQTRERRFLMPVKSNLCAPAATLAFRIISSEGRGRLRWEDKPVNSVDVNAVLSPQRPEDAEVRRDTEGFLEKILESGPVLQKDVERAAKAEGIAERTLYRAKKKLGVESDKAGLRGGWYWHLPDKATTSSEPPKTATSEPAKAATHAELAIFEEPHTNENDFTQVAPKAAKSPDVATFEGDLATFGDHPMALDADEELL